MKTITKIIAVLLVSFATIKVNAQLKSRIYGTVKNNEFVPVVNASVSLLRSEDSLLVHIVSTDKKGYFEFPGLIKGNYMVKITYVSFEPFLSSGIEFYGDSSVEISSIILKRKSAAMESVVVDGIKAPIENKLDKMVVNVNASPTNAGNNALEVLAKTPGVSVDREGNISLRGKPGTSILIDGKLTYLSAQELATLLKGIPASQLSQIEVMTQPSSKYDAEGNSGIINLKMAKNRQTGFNGNVNLSYSQGKYARLPNSFLFNYKNRKINLYSSLSYSRWMDFNTVDITRRFYDSSGKGTAVFIQNSDVKYIGYNYTGRVGLDYSIDKKTNIGFAVTGIANSNKSNVESISNIFDGQNILDSIGNTSGHRNDLFKNFGVSLNFEKNIDSTGRKFSADADYIHYRNTSDQQSYNYVDDIDGGLSSPPLLLRAFLPSNISIYSFRAEYTHPLKNNAKIELGAKNSFVEIDNQAPYEIYSNSYGKWVTDSSRADHFRYRENINAVYLNYSKQLNKWSFQGGVRYEQTNLTGRQVSTGKSYPRNYSRLFPTLYLGYHLSRKNQLVFSYGRRINRPNYQDMNPFQRFLDKFTYIQGNPFLQPQITNNFELSHQYNNHLFTTINYTYTNKVINDILIQNDSTKVTYRTRDNIGTSRSIGLSISYNTAITPWWSVNVYATYYKNYYSGLLNNVQLKVDASNFLANFSSQFKFGKGLRAELSGSYKSRMLENGIYRIAPRGDLSIGFAKQILKDKGTIRLNFIDPFNLQMSRSSTKYGNIDMEVVSHWDNRRINLGFTYKFAKGKNEQRKSKTELLDEQKRVN